ncbi:hypothetical protein GCM10010406_27200 [Streptomyces thermolineatus]|uniref:CBM6 domain-containing protein n=1 Tax=Streptomyces thermolineatus TaxID=44033 RepID=A0ABP5Z332_9ACTN
MTAGPNGTPENDDPFAYLYRGEGEQGAGQGTAGQPGVPRTSYNQVSRVGERRPSAPGGYGYPPQAPQPQPQPGGQGPAAPGGRAASRQAAGAAQGGGPNRKGLLIGAIAVVAAVVVGISVAALSSGDDEDKQADDPAATAPADPGGEDPGNKAADGDDDKGKDKKDAKKFKTLTAFANSLRLDGGATASTEHAGASGPNGAYVDHMNVVGASATWTFDVPEAGPYTFFIGYGNAGETATPTLTVNGTAQDRKINMDNFTGEKDWSKAWTKTFSFVNLNKGTNTLKISCEDGDKCGFNLDKVWLKQGNVER